MALIREASAFMGREMVEGRVRFAAPLAVKRRAGGVAIMVRPIFTSFQ